MTTDDRLGRRLGACSTEPAASPWIRGVIGLRGKVVPIYDLAARLGLVVEANPTSRSSTRATAGSESA